MGKLRPIGLSTRNPANLLAGSSIEGYRSKGLGTELVSYWEKKMKDEGHRLLITSTRSDEEAQHFYRKLGYIDMGGFIPPGEPLELMMYKEI